MSESASTLVLQGAVLPARKTLALSVRKLVPAALIFIALAYFTLILFLPLVTVLVEALDKGFAFYAESLLEAEALDAMKLTLLMAVLVVPLNAAFGIAAAWLLGKFRFPGRSILLTLIDLPLSVSPVVAGLVFVLMFGAQSALGPWLLEHDIKIIFALPGIWLSSLFVTLPYVAREVLPLLEAQGNEQEESAVMLGANGWQTFRYISLPQMKWALIHGVILCNARVMGEFGAVSVVSGHIRGETNTLPLLVEILYNEYQFTAAFAAASVLAVLALITLVIKRVAVKNNAIVSEH
ncbi:MAG TPA: sulfate ABC transporter permease subunit CysW [Oligoflexus sp.]|uniref:sulfate ABC transporter permease subunit CysW n=1 Tax=Oligoflexus sp. TaxID=1971216 RepID=UPI002D7FACCD|nr:sulfate ABC transporter permease subunit CysW [Oligoflexus sp.]HET9239045.1 sulfate ABC transporter permease subunit CysW [Oligoflexus sp.]